MPRFNPQKYARIPLIFLLILSAIGLLLRWQTVDPLPVNYRHFVHAHSHTAFMGWVYNALYLLVIFYFISEEQRTRRFFWYFIWLQAGVVGMLFSFPFQGYGAVAISFSTLHLAAGVAVAISFFRLLRHDRSLSATFLRWALFYQLVSGLGPLLLGPLAVMGLKDSPWYSLAIYFFMHFQFNGWFVLGCLALLFRWFENNKVVFPGILSRWLTYTLAWMAGPAFLMSALWTEAGQWFYAVAIPTALLQVLGAWILLQTVWPVLGKLLKTGWLKWCFLLGISSLSLKFLLQLGGSIPGIDNWAFANQGVVIAFIHLVFIGVASFMLFGFYLLAGWMKRKWMLKTGLTLFFSGFVLTEIILIAFPVSSLAGVAFHVPYFEGLVLGAGLLFLGSVLIVTDI